MTFGRLHSIHKPRDTMISDDVTGTTSVSRSISTTTTTTTTIQCLVDIAYQKVCLPSNVSSLFIYVYSNKRSSHTEYINGYFRTKELSWLEFIDSSVFVFVCGGGAMCGSGIKSCPGGRLAFINWLKHLERWRTYRDVFKQLVASHTSRLY